MQNALSEKIRIAAQGLILTEGQRNIVAGRLTRALLSVDLEAVSVEELRELIREALVGVPGGVSYVQKEHEKPAVAAPTTDVAEEDHPAITEVDEDAYRVNHVVRRTNNG